MRTTRFAVHLLLFSLALSLTACSKGPDRDSLRSDLQGKLDGDFKQDLFEVTEFDRNGHYGFTADDGSAQLLIYFKARLKLKQDYTFSAWEQLNLSALTSVLGASSEGVKGVKHDGNKAGDEVRVMGTLTYAEEGEGWALTGLSPQGEAGERAPGMDEPGQFEKDLAALAKRYTKAANKKKTAHVAAIEAEVGHALRNIGLQLDSLDGVPSLVTGVESGEYNAIGRGLAKVAHDAEIKLGHYGSAGSVENCLLVGEGRADFAIVQNDVAWLAAQGQELFSGLPQPDLRAVCALYPEAIQVVTLASSGIKTIGELAGKRVNLGPLGSGSRSNAVLVLGAYGIDVEGGGLAEAGTGGIDAAVTALKAGEVDAFFLTTAAPARALEELAAAKPITFLPISGPQAESLRGQRGYLASVTLLRNTYPGLDADVPTLGVTAIVVTRQQTPAERVDALLGLLFDHAEELAQHSALAGAINRKTARAGLSIPMHPAAEAKLPQE